MTKWIAVLLLCLLLSNSAKAVTLKTDPTRPLRSDDAAMLNEDAVAKTFVLQAIQTTNNSKYAVINGKLVATGDTIGQDTQLIAIGDNEVVINRFGSEYRIYLLNYSVRQEKNN